MSGMGHQEVPYLPFRSTCPHSRSSPITIHWSPFSITMSSVRCIQLAELQAKHEENLRLQELHDHAHNDQEYQDLLQLIQAGFPDHKVDLPPNLKKFWVSRSQHPKYGTITAVSPHRRYFIRTQSGRVLVRNRRFIRKRTALSVHAPGVPAQVPLEQQQRGPPPAPAPRCSGRESHRPVRLIEDNTWG